MFFRVDHQCEVVIGPLGAKLQPDDIYAKATLNDCTPCLFFEKLFQKTVLRDEKAVFWAAAWYLVRCSENISF